MGTVIQQLLTEVWIEGRVQDLVVGLRLPRLVIGILTGGALASAGVILQTMTHNPLASASTLGINAGAYFAVVVSIIFFPGVLGNHPFVVAVFGAVFISPAVLTWQGES
ncbi:MAG: iron chelate uptake ABC transporter family permease subunit [Alkalibacterium sp.]|nr:iron chelate uptake ABC transporter family permease subunit [Alkalibacterium sp.]